MKNLYIILLLTLGLSQDYSLQFDGVDDYVETNYQGVFGSNARTISFDADGIGGCVLSYGTTNDGGGGQRAAFLVFMNSNTNTLEINLDLSTYLYSRLENDGVNNFTIVLPKESGNYLSDIIVYQNGTSLNYINGGSNDGLINTANDQPVNIGRSYRNSHYFDGLIDNVQIWNRALDGDEINGQYDSDEGLIADWKFNAGDGDILYDHSGNENHGTIYGATWAGCTDPLAENYLPDAELDDGSCEYDLENENDIFIEQHIININQYTYIESSNLESGQQYYLIVTGTGSGGGSEIFDAAYEFNNNNPPVKYSRWDWDISGEFCEQGDNGNMDFRPSPDLYNSEHTYYYPFVSDGDSERFCMLDGAYGDNWGALIVEIWQMVSIGCTNPAACNYVDSEVEDDGSCWYAEENHDCDGNCTLEVDCNGICGGGAVIDDCGICGGNNETIDCNGDCDGEAYLACES